MFPRWYRALWGAILPLFAVLAVVGAVLYALRRKSAAPPT